VSLPSIRKGLDKLLGVGKDVTHDTLNRDKQMATLSGLGKDVLLSVLSQGVLPAQLATALEVSYETFNEYMRLTATPEELRKAESLGADAMVSSALDGLNEAVDKEDLQQAKAIAEYTFKIAKTMNHRYSDKPSTAVSGLRAQGTESRSRAQNQDTAFRRLVALMRAKDAVRAERRQDTATIRNYHAVRNEVHDKASGKKMLYTEVVENRNIAPMIAARAEAQASE